MDIGEIAREAGGDTLTPHRRSSTLVTGIDARGAVLQVDVLADRKPPMPFRIDLFGHVRVIADGAPVAVTGRMPRALVARLALAAGTAVTVDELVADLWERPPDAANSSLRAYMSRLRQGELGRVLGGGRGGYSVDLAPAAVDVLRYRALLSAAKLGDAYDHLSEAELAWTATPLDGLAGIPFADRERTALLQEKRAAVLELGDLRLEAGELSGVLESLHPLVAANQLDERALVLLATATSRLGRTAEALELIDDFARSSAEELGLDPSRRLATLRQSIVRYDPIVLPSGEGWGPVERHGLPLPVTTFVGRSTELAQLVEARLHSRLTTLVGPGGVGKTRLAIEAARQLTPDDDHEQWMLELAPLAKAADVLPALAELVGASATTVDAVAEKLSGRRVLLILDNAEHVLDEVADLSRRLLAGAAGLAVLVTSREAMRLPGERIVAVGPMAGSEADDAMRLFAARAADVSVGFALDATSIPLVRALCRRLDGIPLAIELAAARLDVLDLQELGESIQADALLDDGASRDGRQGSLSATIHWSIELLSPSERELLGQLARFAGYFTLEAVAGICSVSEGRVQDVAISLVRKSLIAVDRVGGAQFYRLLQSVREYVNRSDCALAAPALVGWEERHLRWYADWIGDIGAALRTDRERAARTQIEAARPDLVLALEQAFEQGDREAALKLAGGQSWHWFRQGALVEGRVWIDRALALPGETDPAVEARALFGAVMLIYRSSEEFAGRRYAFDGLILAERSGDPSLRALFWACTAMWKATDGDPVGFLSRIDRAVQLIDQAEAWVGSEVHIFRSIGAVYSDRPAAALDALADASQAAVLAGHHWAAIAATQRTAHVLIRLRRGEDALRQLSVNARRALADNDPLGVLLLLYSAAGATTLIERHDLGAKLLGAIDGIGRRQGFEAHWIEPPWIEPTAANAYRERVRQGLTPRAWRDAHASGSSLTLASAVELLDCLG